MSHIMDKRLLFFCGTSLAAAIAAFGLGACSSTVTVVGAADAAPDAATEASSSVPQVDSSIPVEVDAGTTPDPDLACAKSATKMECGQCCITNHQTGYAVAEYAAVRCGCQGTGSTIDAGTDDAGVCATACAATPMAPDEACRTCLQGSSASGGACGQYVTTECSPVKDCVAVLKCLSKCGSLP